MSNWRQYIASDEEFKELVENNRPIEVGSDFYCNSGVELYGESGGMIDAVYDANIKAIRKINDYNPIFHNSPNRDIALYNDYLLNEDINTIIVDGIFGTGKTSTLCSHLVPILSKGLNGEKNLEKVYISKPHESLGKDYGYLPGELMDKVAYEFASYYQYFDRFGQPGFADKLISFNILEVVVFEYLRGRDLDSGWVILDEAQNTSVKEMISFLSRIGDGAKLVILGDSSNYQIDKRGNNQDNNGLTFVKDLYTTKKYAGFIELDTVSHILRGQRVKDMYLTMRDGGGVDECSN
jgi:predicted ribonuclease YlaK